MRKRVGRRSSEVLRNMQKAVLSGTLNIARTFKIATWEDYVFLVYTQFYFYLTVFFLGFCYIYKSYFFLLLVFIILLQGSQVTPGALGCWLRF